MPFFLQFEATHNSKVWISMALFSSMMIKMMIMLDSCSVCKIAVHFTRSFGRKQNRRTGCRILLQPLAMLELQLRCESNLRITKFRVKIFSLETWLVMKLLSIFEVSLH